MSVSTLNEAASRPATGVTPKQAGFHAGTVEIRAAVASQSGPCATLWRRCTVTIPAGEGGLAEFLDGYSEAIQAYLHPAGSAPEAVPAQ